VRFALYDGQSLHVLADQASGDRFAGRRVVIVGSLNQEARTLTAKSIESL
jgi:hypothetical protein